MLHGIAVSPGVVVAPAFVLDAGVDEPAAVCGAADVAAELARFDHACEETARELRALIDTVSSEIGDREAGIFKAHLLILRDRAFVGKVKTWIVENNCTAAK